jgi:hypothetical protein
LIAAACCRREQASQPLAAAPLPSDAGSHARTILHHLLEHGDIAGRRAAVGQEQVDLRFREGR